MECTQQQYYGIEAIKYGLEYLMSESDPDWDYIIESIEHIKNVKKWCPTKENEDVKHISEWFDPIKYREGFTEEEYLTWLKLKSEESMLNRLKEERVLFGF